MQPKQGGNEKETWKDIPNYEGVYLASNTGRIMSKRWNKNRIIGASYSHGYSRVCLHSNGDRKYLSIHRLVWLAFCGNIPIHLEINHKNGNKSDNRLSNLELVTRSENVQHAIRTGLVKIRKGEENKNSKLDNNTVLEIRELYRQGWTQRQLNKKFGINCAYNIVTGTSWNHLPDSIKDGSRGLGKRKARGCRINTAKLTESQVVEIRKLYATGKFLFRELAERYGLSTPGIIAVVRRQSWKHI